MIRKYTIDPPFAHIAGDEYRKVGLSWQQWRGETLIDIRANPAVALLDGQEAVGGSQIKAIYEERNVASKTVTNVTVSGTSVYFDFSDGSQRELPGGHTAGLVIAADLDANGQLAADLLIAKAYRHSPDGTALDDIIGSTVNIDTAAQVPIQFNLSQAIQNG